MKALATLAAILAVSIALPATAQTALKTKRIVASGLVYPTFVTHAPGDASRLFVLEKAGRIRIVDLTTNTLLATSFLDIDPIVVGGTSLSDEQGLLGLAFDPNYATNGQFYVYYTGSGTNNLARYSVSAGNPNLADTTSGRLMMTWSDPYVNHNGGWIGFGPDNNLYMAVGDGGSANDPGNRAQTLVNMRLGKMHRIKPTVGGASPYYTIPAGNPFVGTTGASETWAYGLRNPWRCSFDRQTGDLWIGDVGQGAIEEIDFQPANSTGGENYGWRCMEGANCTGLSGCTCFAGTLVSPIHTYTHVSNTSGGYAVIGGYVYRGCRIPDLQGTYFFADNSTGNFWSFRYVNGVKSNFLLRNSELGVSLEGAIVNQIASFGEDANGEMYIADHGGQIYKIVPASGDGTCAILGDINGDGVVDGADLGILLGSWGGTSVGDLNGDGKVDGADLGILLGNWS